VARIQNIVKFERIIMEFKKAESEQEFKKQLKAFMRLQFGDKWEGIYCDDVYDLVLQYCQARELEIHGRLVKKTGGCHG